MTSKIFWFDVETTGLSPYRDTILQLAYIIEIDGHPVEERNLYLNPLNIPISEAAARVHGITPKIAKDFPSPSDAYHTLIDDLSLYVNRYDRVDKFVVAGYNVNFDAQFLRGLFRSMGDKYYGSWFFPCPLDVYSDVAKYVAHGLRLPNVQLSSLCAYHNIPLGEEAHDALADLRATRELASRLCPKFGHGLVSTNEGGCDGKAC